VSALRRLLLGLAGLALLGAGLLWQINFNDGVDTRSSAPVASDAATRARGAYLARAGNCLACHTARGGPAAAGGRPIATPFGTVYSSNLTPDARAGIGGWNAATFWRALHHGRSADGRLLNPVFPYTHTTGLTRADSDALFSYFLGLPPSATAVPAHELRWPFGTQAALALWRALYFRPGSFQPDPARSEQLNRGAYLVQAVAHCSACHTPRDRLGGADWQSLSGGTVPGTGWYAPSLTARDEGAVGHWPAEQIVQLLATGAAPQGVASGPMAEVVYQGTQHLSGADLQAVAAYLQHLPPQPGRQDTPAPRQRPSAAGERLYGQHCAACHGEDGQGVPGAYPPLSGNRSVTMANTQNLLQIVLFGGFGPATAGRPQPFGMPPFALTLSDAEIAAVLSYIRGAWGNDAGEVAPLDVVRMRHVNHSGLP